LRDGNGNTVGILATNYYEGQAGYGVWAVLLPGQQVPVLYSTYDGEFHPWSVDGMRIFFDNDACTGTAYMPDNYMDNVGQGAYNLTMDGQVFHFTGAVQDAAEQKTYALTMQGCVVDPNWSNKWHKLERVEGATAPETVPLPLSVVAAN
jgi:hypothetical protein